MEDASAPKGFKYRVAEELPVVKDGVEYGGMGHPTLVADGAKGLMGGEVTPAGNGGVMMDNLSGRMVHTQLMSAPSRGHIKSLELAADEFRTATGIETGTTYYNPYKLSRGAPPISTAPSGGSNGGFFTPEAAGAAGVGGGVTGVSEPSITYEPSFDGGGGMESDMSQDFESGW